MQKVDVVLSGGTILTMDAHFSLFEPGAVAVCGEEIFTVGGVAYGLYHAGRT